MLPKKLQSLSLSTNTINALKSAGFETVDDFEGLDADQLSEGASNYQPIKYYNTEGCIKEIKLPSFLCEQILKEVEKSRVAPPSTTQSVSSLDLLEATKTTFSICPPADLLLHNETISHPSATREGSVEEASYIGLKRGTILELSGPPGSPKERIMLECLRNFVDAGEKVLFLGKACEFTHNLISHRSSRRAEHDNTIYPFRGPQR